MGIFDWLWKPNASRVVQVLPDSVWLTKSAKFQGLTRTALADENADCVLLLAHFDDTAGLLNTIAERLSTQKAIFSCKLGDLNEHGQRHQTWMSASDLLVLVGERHPLPGQDELVASFFEEREQPTRVAFHVSIEDPVMNSTGGDWLEKTLRSLGMADDEAIVSPMVSRRIMAAGKQVAARCTSNLPAGSAEEWFELNDPSWQGRSKDAPNRDA